MDFGFNTTDYDSTAIRVPYAQFLNNSTKNSGLAITSQNVEMINLDVEKALTCGWQSVDHEFSDGTVDTLLFIKNPKMVIINKSTTYMANDQETIEFDKDKYRSGDGYKAFTYLIILLLDDDNNPLADSPVRLKCSGISGLTFNQHYSYWNKSDSFCNTLLAAYKEVTGDRAINKNEVFYAHGVYQPLLERKKVSSSNDASLSSNTVVTVDYATPDKTNLGKFIIKNGSPVSDRIKEFMETTKDWIDIIAKKTDDINQEKIDDIKEEINSADEEIQEEFSTRIPF